MAEVPIKKDAAWKELKVFNDEYGRVSVVGVAVDAAWKELKAKAGTTSTSTWEKFDAAWKELKVIVSYAFLSSSLRFGKNKDAAWKELKAVGEGHCHRWDVVRDAAWKELKVGYIEVKRLGRFSMQLGKN